MKRFWPEIAVLVLSSLLAVAAFADPQAGCQGGRCALPQRMPVGPPPVATTPTTSDATAGQPAERFPVVKKVIRRISQPFGGRFRR